MSDEVETDVDREFEQRTRSLLLESAEALPGTLRSRLTQARYAALEARRTRNFIPARARGWMGATAAAAVVALLVMVPHQHGSTLTAPASASIDDLELLAESDAVPLSSEDQDVDYDFYEWAVNEADTPAEAAPSVGT